MTKTPGYTGVQWRGILDREEYPRLKKILVRATAPIDEDYQCKSIYKCLKARLLWLVWSWLLSSSRFLDLGLSRRIGFPLIDGDMASVWASVA